jgi:hypothetical protein
MKKHISKLLAAAALAVSALGTASDEHGKFELGAGHNSDLHGNSAGLVWFAWPVKAPIEKLLDFDVDAQFYFVHLDGRDQRNGDPRGKTFGLGHEMIIMRKPFYLSSGFFLRDRDSDTLSTRWNFASGIGLRWDDYTVGIRHFSNAGTGGKNRGENLLFLSRRF